MSKESASKPWRLPQGLVILYEDRDILVVNKPAGLLTIATESERSATAYYILTDYVRKGSPRSRNRIFIVHRLDRETSGVLLLAKTEEAKFRLQEEWQENVKIYLAIVEGRMPKITDTISTYLAENSTHLVYSTPDPSKGKLSHTAYRVVRETKSYTLLELELLTGRKNQIRVHLADVGRPIVGDKKYGNARGATPGLALHAQSLSFHHPTTGRPMTFAAEPPSLFQKLVGTVAPRPPREP